ncbi:hypothetical protein E5676_scaffold384G00860 [Cucumis melo var. makuwa]|uniref:Uncharacterized protein n=2 Tax=Cucumis melo TaxID=3656 RepID=A0A5A7VHE0_CUCMM|nr:hypothetical protein E6C27_scaffold271G00930 [Cucumis melo var. makuwa]TYK27901.1 hypothetical protein E5676_scaffold384G00860 [Cucumis melo var. makuwa]
MMGSRKFIMVALLVVASVLCQAHMSLGIRKLSNKEMKMVPMGVDVNYMLLGALPKGPTPPSAPSERGNPAPFSDGDRVLVSAPSPGIGHR